jgi:hypothetical protein
MANISPEQEVLGSLVSQAYQAGLANRERFDPTGVTELIDALEAKDSTPVFLRQTTYLTPISDVGRQVVAIFAYEGPAKSRQTSEDIIHQAADQAILLRRPSEDEVRSMSQNIRPKLAWIFELAMPVLGSGKPSSHIARTGLQSSPFMRTVV